MNDKRLRIYLEDHLAVMVGELELVARCWANNRGQPLGDFLQQLEGELKGQKCVADDVLQRLGGASVLDSRLKQGAAWFAEKMGRFKRNDSWLTYSELSRVIELETLAATAEERMALWDNLDIIGSADLRLEGITFVFFHDQSQHQLAELNKLRRIAARAAFLGN